MTQPAIPALFLRAALLRCPNCGAGGLFESWFRIRPACLRCGIETERGEEGYVVGAYMFNIITAELAWLGIVGAVTIATWPEPPWNLLLFGGGGLMIALPFLFYPFAKTIFLAFDLVFRPAGRT